jgi:coenzyme F420-reducing hydrogenase delta subunit
MYLYLCDYFLGKRKYKKILDKIETRITDLGISGRIIRLTILESIEEIVKEAVKKGTETIIVIGNDKTFSQAASALANSNATLGFIPVGKENKIAEILGIPKEELACEVISARLTETVDLGKINNNYFFSMIEINSHKIFLEDEKWKIFLSPEISKVKVINLGYYFDKISNPLDGFLEVVFEKKKESFPPFFFKEEKTIDSLLFLKKLKINTLKDKKGVPVLVDNWRVLKTPVKIDVLPKGIKIIVGKRRKFSKI